MSQFCGNCGQDIQGLKFCTGCGSPSSSNADNLNIVQKFDYTESGVDRERAKVLDANAKFVNTMSTGAKVVAGGFLLYVGAIAIAILGFIFILVR